MTLSFEDLQKGFANRLAQLASTSDGARALSMFKHSGLLVQRSIEAKGRGSALKELLGWELPDQPLDSDHIGIWRRPKNSVDFMRDIDKRQEWNYWANTPRIDGKAKRGKKRIIFLGESVARGYCYDPQFTPAKVLEVMLRSQFGPDGIEVVDLAQLGIGFQVGELALSALALEPDAAIIFSGNNWRPDQVGSMDISCADSALRQQSIPALKKLFERNLSEKTSLLIQTVGSAYEKKQIPMLWVIPEFNLRDWRDPISNAPYLPADSNSKWSFCWERAVICLQEGNISEAEELARSMIELDGGVSSAGFYLLADCNMHQKNDKASRNYLEAARDANIWSGSMCNLSPRPFSISQQIMREKAVTFEKSGILDLPRFFEEYLNGDLPDRRLFLDYCHMTSEAIQVSMAAVASHITSVITGTNLPWSNFLDQDAKPNRGVEAEAMFLAAVHNAHNCQNYELIHHYCSTALKLAPELSEVMVKFAEVQARGISVFLSTSGEELIEMPWPSVQRHLFGQHEPQLDQKLTGAITASLRTIGIDISMSLNKIRKEARSISIRPTNLLESYYISSADQPQETQWTVPGTSPYRQQDYYRAFSNKSRFFFIGDALCPTSLVLTFRLPNSLSGIIEIRVNEEYQHQIPGDCEWKTWDILLDPSAIGEGVNELTIHWPTPTYPTSAALHLAADAIQQGMPPQLYCSFGDIHSFIAEYQPGV